MFGTKCPNCRSKLSKKFSFCPRCGTNIMKKTEQEDYGLLGLDDRIEPMNLNVMPFNLNKIFNGLIKQLSQELREDDKEILNPKLNISISSLNGGNPEIKIIRNGQKNNPEVKIQNSSISEEKAKKFSKLPRIDAETKVRRLSNKLIYEISVPGIEDKSDIFINKLENSIEIKAFSKDKVYLKTIPVNMPILNYNLEDGKLILELKS